MLLSVIIPVYNGQRYLEQAVRSVSAQPCTDIEIIIIDDGSTDQTGPIADGLATRSSRIRVIHTGNHGAAHARNLGLERASGAYVAFLDGDDVWCPHAIDQTVEQTLRDQTYDILSFGYFHADPELRWGKPVPVVPGTHSRNDPEYSRAISGRSFCSFLLRRALLEDLRFPEGIRYHEDITFLFLFARKSRNILRIDRDLFLYRNHLASAMHVMPDWRYILTEEIPAWCWARSRAACEDDRSVCDGMICSLMWDYLHRSALWGISAASLKADLDSCTAFQDALLRSEKFRIRPEAAAFLEAFSADPAAVCRTYRLLGLPCRAARFLTRQPLLRRLYLRLKYRTSLVGYIP